MNENMPLPFGDFSARFRSDLRKRPVFYIVSGPSLARSGAAIGTYIEFNPMIGAHNVIGGTMDILRPLNRPLDIWVNITAQQDVSDWTLFLDLLATPETALILTPFAWMAHSHLMELEREFIIRHFHKVIPFDLEAQALFQRIQVNTSVNSLTYFLFFAHLLEMKGPIFLFGCDGVAPDGTVRGYEDNVFGGVTGSKHVANAEIDKEKQRGTLYSDTKGLNENWPAVVRWLEARNIRRIPIFNVGGAGHVTAFEPIEPDQIADKIRQCDEAFDPAQRTLSSGQYWDFATLQANIARYEHFCSQFPSALMSRRVIPFVSEAATLIKQTKDQFSATMDVVQKTLSKLI